MQNRTDFMSPRFSTPQTNMDVSIKVPKSTKYGIKMCYFFRFLIYFQYLGFSFVIYVDTRD